MAFNAAETVPKRLASPITARQFSSETRLGNLVQHLSAIQPPGNRSAASNRPSDTSAAGLPKYELLKTNLFIDRWLRDFYAEADLKAVESSSMPLGAPLSEGAEAQRQAERRAEGNTFKEWNAFFYDENEISGRAKPEVAKGSVAEKMINRWRPQFHFVGLDQNVERARDLGLRPKNPRVFDEIISVYSEDDPGLDRMSDVRSELGAQSDLDMESDRESIRSGSPRNSFALRGDAIPSAGRQANPWAESGPERWALSNPSAVVVRQPNLSLTEAFQPVVAELSFVNQTHAEQTTSQSLRDSLPTIAAATRTSAFGQALNGGNIHSPSQTPEPDYDATLTAEPEILAPPEESANNQLRFARRTPSPKDRPNSKFHEEEQEWIAEAIENANRLGSNGSLRSSLSPVPPPAQNQWVYNFSKDAKKPIGSHLAGFTVQAPA